MAHCVLDRLGVERTADEAPTDAQGAGPSRRGSDLAMMSPREHLREDLLTDCAEQLRAKTEECDELRCENAFMKLQLRILTCRLRKLGNGHDPR